MDTTRWTRHGLSILDRLQTTQPPPPTWLVLAAALIALAAVAYWPVWQVCRNVVTITHEGGHALMALLVGRTLDRVGLHSDTSGVTVSRGKPDGFGMIVTLLAGYPAPPLFGVMFAALLGLHRITLMLWLVIMLLLALLIKIRNAYGVLAVVATGVAVFAVSWFGTDTVQATFAYVATWFLLIGGIRPVWELRHARRYRTGSDADQLGQLTVVPPGAWVVFFAAAALAALLYGGHVLVNSPNT